MSFTPAESRILGAVQKGIPLEERPFLSLADSLAMQEDEVLGILSDLKKRKVIRNIAGIFSAGRLGFESTLAAFSVPEERIEEAAAAISAHPGVSHNYLRGNEYNIWFTLAVPPGSPLDRHVEALARMSHARDSLVLRTEVLYKIGVFLDVEGGGAAPPRHGVSSGSEASVRPLSDGEKLAVSLLQIDLPLVARPFEAIIQNAGSPIPLEMFLGHAGNFLREGIMRRYAAVLAHRRAGFTTNAMTAWKPSDPQEISRKIGLFVDEPSISHLYLRTVYPGRWEYPLFAMVHAKSAEELAAVLSRLSRASGWNDYLALESLKEFKKQRVIYYSPAFFQWEKENSI